MPKRQRQVGLDEHTIGQVQRLADEREWSWSKTAGRCIEIGLIDGHNDVAGISLSPETITALAPFETGAEGADGE